MRSLRELVSQIYYTHGLFCASHPYGIILGVMCVVAFTCYPLTKVPLPGNAPLEYVTPTNDYRPQYWLTPPLPDDEGPKIPRWYQGPSVGYVQQIVIKSVVSPWTTKHLVPIDAFRGPLSKAFKVLDALNNFKHQALGQDYSLSDFCLRVPEMTYHKNLQSLMPQYSCLLLSPSNLWHNDITRFKEDPEILKTVFKKYSQTMEAPPTIKDILFGLPWKNTGVTRYFIRNRQRTISFALTVILKSYNQNFIDAMKTRLELLYPETIKNVNNSQINHITHIHFKEINVFVEYTPLIVTYLVLLLYLYFSVRKIEMVKSKWGLAFSAVITVVASLLMSVSICTVFGLTPSLNGGEIFPYLVVIIGLENVLVLTKSVVSTPVHLEVKVRIAQGLSKEGWSITKNLLTELLIVLVGFFTFVPAIQEFCLFAVVGLLTDFFLQMVFFATVLSVDIRRMELSDLHKQKIYGTDQTTPDSIKPLVRCPIYNYPDPATPGSMPRSKSEPRLGLDSEASLPSPPPSPGSPAEEVFFPGPILRLPRRLRLIYFWANTRMFQRIIMVCTVIWIALIVYKTGLVEHLARMAEEDSNGDIRYTTMLPQDVYGHQNGGEFTGTFKHPQEESNTVEPLEHNDLELWRRLSYNHWPMLFKYYNISLSGRYLSILPSLHLSIPVSQQEAIKLHHATEDEKYYSVDEGEDAQDMLASHRHVEGATDNPLSNRDHTEPYRYDPDSLDYWLPRSHKELFITILLALLSVVCITYFMVILYRCVCPRRYDKWRVSWARPRRGHKMSKYYKKIKESVPLVLKGHIQEVECLVSDGQMIISSCLGGQLRVWDSITGECITAIQRKSISVPMERNPCLGRNIEDSEAELYAEYHGDKKDDLSSSELTDDRPRTRQRNTTKGRSPKKKAFTKEPDLTGTIDTDFNFTQSLKNNPSQSVSASSLGTEVHHSYDFQKKFQSFYDEHMLVLKDSMTESHKNLKSERTTSREIDFGGDRVGRCSEGDACTTSNEEGFLDNGTPSVWCLACQDNLIIAGCGSGRIEVWDGCTGTLKCLYESSGSGVTHLCFVGNRVIAARLSGELDFLELETFQSPAAQVSPGVRHNRGYHQLSPSSSPGLVNHGMKVWNEEIHCTVIQSRHAHQLPINVLKAEGGRVVSASQDHSLKVFRLEDCLCLYTLHGHTASVTALCLDKYTPYAAASGSADGTIRVWDLLTGTCVHKIVADSDTILKIVCTNNYIISCGMADRLCVWERNRGSLVHSFDLEPCGASCIALLNNNLMVTGGQGCIYLWDLRLGRILRTVNLGRNDKLAQIHHVQVLADAIAVCDYASEIKVVYFPTVIEKAD
ncbi:hypothetical protein ScPMuIL_015159 [Solemya velum]